MKSKVLLGLVLPGLCAVGAFAASSTLTNVPNANPKAVGLSSPNVLSPELIESPVAQGSWKFENPSAACGSTTVSYYGYNDDGTMLPALGSNVEATKTEPDKNTYLVLQNQGGADSHYNYGEHFLFQGHEGGNCGVITRINLDADQAHRVTLMATAEVNGTPLPLFDGSTWYPFSQRLLLTEEETDGGVWQASLDFPSRVENLSTVFGQAAYEGIQADAYGSLILVEDSGGVTGTANPHAKQPNSFIYRFVPVSPMNLMMGGKLQALQVISLRTGTPIIFHPGAPDGDIISPDRLDLHTYGLTLGAKWVTIHDTAVDPPGVFNANALAKTKGATPFKRPENGQFHPGTGFSEFIFDETGDTDSRTEAGSLYGGFGSIYRLKMFDNGTNQVSLVYRGDLIHNSFDNCGFWSKDAVVFVEDAGDTLHSQRNGLDSAWLIDLTVDYGNPANQPVRVLAEGRDASATIDSGLSGTPGFQNEGDNEITGWHMSDGDPSVSGILGGKIPQPLTNGWRLFFTQQHGDNFTWEILLHH